MRMKRYPQCIEYNAETVKRKTVFILKKMNWPLEAMVLIPQVFGYSREKRIIPRFNVIKTLMSSGLMKDGNATPPMQSVLFKDASEVKSISTSLKAGEAGYDPFSRRWTRSSKLKMKNMQELQQWLRPMKEM